LRLPPQFVWVLAFLGCCAVYCITSQKSKVLRSVTVLMPHPILFQDRNIRREKYETFRLNGGNEKCISDE
jgi:hypothetical protein